MDIANSFQSRKGPLSHDPVELCYHADFMTGNRLIVGQSLIGKGPDIVFLRFINDLSQGNKL